jgi:hypothetical protein
MCWSADVSISTFLLGFITILFKAYQGYPLMELGLYFTVILVQLFEYFIWTYYSNPGINTIATILIMITIFVQPITSIMLLGNKNYNLVIILLLVYILSVFLIDNKKVTRFASLSFDELKKEYNSYRGKDGHLVWSWMKKKNRNVFIIYLLFLLVPMLIYGMYDLFFIGLIFFIISFYRYNKYDTFGSMWCWFANLWSIYLIIKK